MSTASCPRILVVSGSSRPDSHVHEIVNLAADTAASAGADVQVLRLHDLDLPVMRPGDPDQDALDPVIRARAGAFMFGGVAMFGLATVVFGLSKSLWLSVAALAVLGGADMLSVFVRQTLVQLVTPDHMRGRVASVSSVFIGASNELGEFESGIVARILGPIGAAVFGGVGAVMVTGRWPCLFPASRRADRLA